MRITSAEHLKATIDLCVAALELDEALDMPYAAGQAILVKYGFIHADRFELPASEFVKQKRRAALLVARGE